MSTAANRPERWGAVSQAFHWLSALLLVGIGSIGLYMEGLRPAPDTIRLYALHKSLGITLLAIVLLRLLWRVVRPAPAPMAGMTRTVRLAASSVHWGLYALMLGVPLAGWVMNSASGYALQWFGLFNLPAIAPAGEALADLAGDVHEFGFWLLALLVAGHVFGAVYHHVFLGDETLRRMLPGGRRRTSETPQ